MLKVKILAFAVITAMFATMFTSCDEEMPLDNGLEKIYAVENGQKFCGVVDTVTGDTLLPPKFKRITQDENFILGIDQKLTGNIEVIKRSDHTWFGEFKTFTPYERGGYPYYIGDLLTEKKKCYYFAKEGRRVTVSSDNNWAALNYFLYFSPDTTMCIIDYGGHIVKMIKKPTDIISNNHGVYSCAYMKGANFVAEEIEGKKVITSLEKWNQYKRRTGFLKKMYGCEIRQSRYKF